MRKKLIKCKACGAEIARSANRCPNCGARQHQGAYIACTVIIVLTVLLCTTVIFNNQNESPKEEGSTTASEMNKVGNDTESSSFIFSGNTANITYESCYDVDSISGCFYVQLQIENTGNVEAVYSLSDVYVDDVACNSGTGLPVTILPGKSGTGAFIIFSEKKLDNIEKVEFKISVRDNADQSVVETSDTITITPK